MLKKSKLQEPGASFSDRLLYSDIVFKIFCIKYPHLLADLLNSVLGFEGNQKITRLKILNPEIALTKDPEIHK